MPVTISGDGGISGLGGLDGYDLKTQTLVVSGDTTIAPQAVGRASLFVDDSANSVGINTTTPNAGVFLEVADGTDPIVRLNNTGSDEVRIGCDSSYGYIGTNGAEDFSIRTANTNRITVLSAGSVGVGTNSPSGALEVQTGTGERIRLDSFGGAQTPRISLVRDSGVDYSFFNDQGVFRIRRDNDELYRFASDNHIFSTAAFGEAFRVGSNGNVGIGTTGPQSKLDIRTPAGTACQLFLNEGTTTNALKLEQTATEARLQTQATQPIILAAQGGSGSTSIIKFETRSNIRGIIDTSGRWVIGEDPTAVLNLRDTQTNVNRSPTVQAIGSASPGAGTGNITFSPSTSAYYAPHIWLAKSHSTSIGGNVIVSDGEELGCVTFAGNDGSVFHNAACIRAQADGTPGANSMPGRLRFYTTSNGATQPTQRMEIDREGTVEINTADLFVQGVRVGRGAGGDASNTVCGTLSLESAQAGTAHNTAVGNGALNGITTGSSNTAVGRNALFTSVAGNNGTAFGFESQRWANSTATAYTNNNTSFGFRALRGTPNNQASNTGINNTAFGYETQRDITTGNNNTAVGIQALVLNTGGSSNTAIGVSVLSTGTVASNGTAVGYQSQQFVNDTTTAFTNSHVSVGWRALRGSTTAANNTGTGCTAIGYESLLLNTSGNNNTACGRSSLRANTTGLSNAAFGNTALGENTTGETNTAIGISAGRYRIDGNPNTDYDNCTYLGSNSRADGSNQVQLGGTATTTYAYGAVQDRSDARDKTDIRDTLLGLDFVKSLRPVDFRWDYRDDYLDKEEYQEEVTDTREVPNAAYTLDGEEPEYIQEEYIRTIIKERMVPVTKDGSRSRGRFHHGLIAQEVKAAADAQGIDFAGYQDHSINGGLDVLSIGYTELIAPLIKAIQELSAEVEALKSNQVN